MSRIAELWRRLRHLLRWGRWRRELAEELQLHQDLAAESGRKLGNELRLLERSQQVWIWRWLEELGGDARHGLRLLGRTPLVTALALASLALGIGANTALFSLADAILMRPLPVQQPSQLVRVFRQLPGTPRASASFTNPIWEQVRDHQAVFSSAFAWSLERFDLKRAGGQDLVWGAYASGGYFSTLGVHAERGRLFTTADDHPGCAPTADISDGFWRSHFGGSAGAVGATVATADGVFTVVGVMPPAFFGTDPGIRVDFVAPLCTEALSGRSMLQIRDAWWLQVMGRLRPGATTAAAGARLEAQAPAWWRATVPGDWNAKQQARYLAARITLEPGARGASFLEFRYGEPIEVLLAVAGLVLLLACANLAGLMQARGAARRAELEVRRALGASRGRLVRQLLAEAVLLAVAGAAVGAALAVGLCRWGEQYLSAGAFTVSLALTPDGRVLAFMAGITVLTALLVGLFPAVAATRGERPRARVRSGRVAAALQLALALVLMAAAGLFLGSFAALTRTDPGFEPGHVSLVELAPPNAPRPAAASTAEFQNVRRVLGALPGVTAVGESFMVPLQGLQWDNILSSSQGSAPDAYLNAIAPGYFATLRTPLLAGRDFSEGDSASAPPVIILNRAAARQLFPHGGALGATVSQPAEPDATTKPARVIGIVADSAYKSLRDGALPQAFYPLVQLQHPFDSVSFELRSPLPLEALTPEVREAMRRAAPSTSYDLESWEGLVATTTKPERLLAAVAALFGGLALLLSGLGLYGVMAFQASRRQREFGVRVALGASRGAITRLVVADAVRTLALGAGAGVIAAFLGARAAAATLSPLLYELRPTDLATLAAAAAVLAAVALVAAYVPARRAARADPLAALRRE
ncbi:MAG: ADOP family duplicated permease [Terriglobales bacterium]